MTRRIFIQKLIKAGSAIIVGTWSLASACRTERLARKGHSAELSRSPAPRKFSTGHLTVVRAVRLKKYPGSLKPLRDVHKQSKWSG